MTAPNHENIDYWLFDWMEGNLSPEQEEQLRIFLLIHPEYEADVDAWRGSKLHNEHLVQPEEVEFVVPQQPQAIVNKKNAVLSWASRFALAAMVFLFWTPLVPTRNPEFTKGSIIKTQAAQPLSVNRPAGKITTQNGNQVGSPQQNLPTVVQP
ncbi:MAG: hypothetical protein EB023_05770, partial [Flavobacteriia bacterium]|nr:hypothetical protein [Flavobacteriia bacterium]